MTPNRMLLNEEEIELKNTDSISSGFFNYIFPTATNPTKDKILSFSKIPTGWHYGEGIPKLVNITGCIQKTLLNAQFLSVRIAVKLLHLCLWLFTTMQITTCTIPVNHAL